MAPSALRVTGISPCQLLCSLEAADACTGGCLTASVLHAVALPSALTFLCAAWPAAGKPFRWQPGLWRSPFAVVISRIFMCTISICAGRLPLESLRVCAGRLAPLEGTRLLLEYCDLAEADKTPIRMVRGHSFSLIGVSGMTHPVKL